MCIFSYIHTYICVYASYIHTHMCVYIYISYIYISLSLSLSVWWLVISDDQKDRYLLSWQGYGAPKCHLRVC